MQEKNPEYISKIVTHILQGMSQGKTWEESFKELGEKAGIENFNPGNWPDAVPVSVAFSSSFIAVSCPSLSGVSSL